MSKHKRPKKLKWKEVKYLNQLLFQADVRQIPWKVETFQTNVPILEWDTDRLFQEVTR